MMAGNGHFHIDRKDRLVTISHIKGHIKIVIIVAECSSGQAHVRGTGIGTGSFRSLTDEADKAF